MKFFIIFTCIYSGSLYGAGWILAIIFILPETIFTVVTTLVLYRLFLFISRKLEEMGKRRDTTIV